MKKILLGIILFSVTAIGSAKATNTDKESIKESAKPKDYISQIPGVFGGFIEKRGADDKVISATLNCIGSTDVCAELHRTGIYSSGYQHIGVVTGYQAVQTVVGNQLNTTLTVTFQ